MLAAFGFVAAGELSGDDGRAQGSFGAVVGRLDARVIEEGEEPLTPLAQTAGDPFLLGIDSGGRVVADRSERFCSVREGATWASPVDC